MPTSKTATSTKSQPQAEKFKAMAKELEADQTEKSMDVALKKIASARSTKAD